MEKEVPSHFSQDEDGCSLRSGGATKGTSGHPSGLYLLRRRQETRQRAKPAREEERPAPAALAPGWRTRAGPRAEGSRRPGGRGRGSEELRGARASRTAAQSPRTPPAAAPGPPPRRHLRGRSARAAAGGRGRRLPFAPAGAPDGRPRSAAPPPAGSRRPEPRAHPRPSPRRDPSAQGTPAGSAGGRAGRGGALTWPGCGSRAPRRLLSAAGRGSGAGARGGGRSSQRAGPLGPPRRTGHPRPSALRSGAPAEPSARPRCWGRRPGSAEPGQAVRALGVRAPSAPGGPPPAPGPGPRARRAGAGALRSPGAEPEGGRRRRSSQAARPARSAGAGEVSAPSRLRGGGGAGSAGPVLGERLPGSRAPRPRPAASAPPPRPPGRAGPRAPSDRPRGATLGPRAPPGRWDRDLAPARRPGALALPLGPSAPRQSGPGLDAGCGCRAQPPSRAHRLLLLELDLVLWDDLWAHPASSPLGAPSAPGGAPTQGCGAGGPEGAERPGPFPAAPGAQPPGLRRSDAGARQERCFQVRYALLGTSQHPSVTCPGS
nr:collagen alpha-1(I) chain-like [Equus asinus]